MSQLHFVSPFSPMFAYEHDILEYNYDDDFTVLYIDTPPSPLLVEREKFETMEKRLLSILDYLNGSISMFVLLCRLFPNQDINFNYYSLSKKVNFAIEDYKNSLK